jgi:hypothetical protein
MATRIRVASVVVVIAIGEPRRALDDLVEFAAVEPDAAALRSEIDFDTLPVADRELDIAPWTLHSGGLLMFCWSVMGHAAGRRAGVS